MRKDKNMTVEQKKEALINAVGITLDEGFMEWGLEASQDNSEVFIMGEKNPQNGFMFFMAGCRDTYGGWFWIEYEPKTDFVAIYIKDRPIQEKFKYDLKNLFEKHSPFNMTITYDENSAPIIFRKEKVLPEDFESFFRGFREAYDEYYPLFYMVSVSAKAWYDGFYIAGSDC